MWRYGHSDVRFQVKVGKETKLNAEVKLKCAAWATVSQWLSRNRPDASEYVEFGRPVTASKLGSRIGMESAHAWLRATTAHTKATAVIPAFFVLFAFIVVFFLLLDPSVAMGLVWLLLRLHLGVGKTCRRIGEAFRLLQSENAAKLAQLYRNS